MKRLVSDGTCYLCEGKFAKNTITRHLQRCLEAHEPSSGNEQKLFHLAIYGHGTYWLHVEMPGTGTFADLDGFLRRIWLECCGHLSLFLFKPERLKRLGVRDEWDFGAQMPGEELMDNEIAEVLEPKLAFGYDYDMGSTTHLQLKVAGIRVGKWAGRDQVRLLARNLPPQILCDQCGGPAEWIDGESGTFNCGSCRDKAGDSEYLLPVVNSPRMGVCGYTGRV
jgi:hypothetical protein